MGKEIIKAVVADNCCGERFFDENIYYYKVKDKMQACRKAGHSRFLEFFRKQWRYYYCANGKVIAPMVTGLILYCRNAEDSDMAK